jgi:hypothetical protein
VASSGKHSGGATHGANDAVDASAGYVAAARHNHVQMVKVDDVGRSNSSDGVVRSCGISYFRNSYKRGQRKSSIEYAVAHRKTRSAVAVIQNRREGSRGEALVAV